MNASQLGDTAVTTAERYSSHLVLNSSMVDQSRKGKNNSSMDPTKTQIQWNRARGSLLPSKNQSKGDLIPMAPISSLMSTEQESYPQIKNYRTQV